MPVGTDEATRRYQKGIEQIGADAYRRAARTNSPSDAAEILEDAKNDRLDTDKMASNYRDSY